MAETDWQIVRPDGTIVASIGTQSGEQKIDKLVLKSLEVTTAGFVMGGQSKQTILESTHKDGLINKSPDGSRWMIQVSNTGQLSAVKIV